MLPDGRTLGELPVDTVTREMLGGVMEAIKRAGKSLAIVEGVRNPVKGYFQSLIDHKTLPAPTPLQTSATSSANKRIASGQNEQRILAAKRHPSSSLLRRPSSRGGRCSS